MLLALFLMILGGPRPWQDTLPFLKGVRLNTTNDYPIFLVRITGFPDIFNRVCSETVVVFTGIINCNLSVQKELGEFCENFGALAERDVFFHDESNSGHSVGYE